MDIVELFKDDIDCLYFENLYLQMPMLSYIASSRTFDRMMFNGTYFEDDIGRNDRTSYNDLIEEEKNNKNQVEYEYLYKIKEYCENEEDAEDNDKEKTKNVKEENSYDRNFLAKIISKFKKNYKGRN